MWNLVDDTICLKIRPMCVGRKPRLQADIVIASEDGYCVDLDGTGQLSFSRLQELGNVEFLTELIQMFQLQASKVSANDAFYPIALLHSRDLLLAS